MKQFLNLSLFFMATLFAGYFLFISCEEEDTKTAESAMPLLLSMSSYGKDGTLVESETYRYDTKGRLIEMVNSEARKAVFEYSPSTLTVKEYDKDTLVYVVTCTLNSQFLCTSFLPDEDQTTTYTYDTNGYHTKKVTQHKNSTFTETYTVSNQNYVTIIYQDVFVTQESALVKEHGFHGKLQLLKSAKRVTASQNILKSASDRIDNYKMDFEFYTDKANTIDLENMGISFFGKQNKNLVKQETETLSNGMAYTSTYSYEYDSKGRVTKKIYEDGDYDVFTYVK